MWRLGMASWPLFSGRQWRIRGSSWIPSNLVASAILPSISTPLIQQKRQHVQDYRFLSSATDVVAHFHGKCDNTNVTPLGSLCCAASTNPSALTRGPERGSSTEARKHSETQNKSGRGKHYRVSVTGPVSPGHRADLRSSAYGRNDTLEF